jgi:hypothetical protein
MATLKPNSPKSPPTRRSEGSILLNEHIYGRWADRVRLCEPARCWSGIALPLASKRARAGTVRSVSARFRANVPLRAALGLHPRAIEN